MIKNKFTTPCYIRKNSQELRDKLNLLGYQICICCNFNDSLWLNNFIYNGTIHGIGYFDDGIYKNWSVEKELSKYVIENKKYIDCGTNEELFLAIAALQNNSDKNQWFVTESRLESVSFPDTLIPKGSFMLCLVDKFEIPENEFDSRGIPAHKATIEELVEYFK